MNKKSSFSIFFFAIALVFGATSCTRYVMVVPPPTQSTQRVVAVSPAPQQHPVVVQSAQPVNYVPANNTTTRQRRPITISVSGSVGSPYGYGGVYGNGRVVYSQGVYGQAPIINGGMVGQRPVVYPQQQVYPYQQGYYQQPYYQAGYRPTSAWYYTGY
jgi:hypothetical protein